MNLIPYIDIHTHQAEPGIETVQVLNLYPGDPIPVFKGKNFCSAGIHPWKLQSEEENNSMLQMMEEAFELDHVIFVGECGLDKNIRVPFDEQLRVFKAQVYMAEEYQKPLIIHCVKSWNEIIEVYSENPPSVPWIFHGYNGSPELSSHLSGGKFLFSFGKQLLKENSKAAESLKVVPLHKVFFETDDTDVPVETMYSRASEILGVSVEDLKGTVWENFNRIENVSFHV